jgi:hypothetical protein
MDREFIQKSLGETGQVGVAVILVGFLVLYRENRRAALGAVAVMVGYGLVTHGLTGSFLESMGMDYDDLY